MDSRELARKMAAAAGIEVPQAQKALAEIPRQVMAELRKGGNVRLGALGTFKAKKQKARRYRDIKTKQLVTVGFRIAVSFDPAKSKKHVT